MLVNGEYFDHLNPDASVITLDVLEHGLAVPRFNNQTTRPITVLEHSLRVRRIVMRLGGDDVAQLAALLHDAPEALVPWGDCLRPGKTDEMRVVERRVLAAICEAIGVDDRLIAKHVDGIVHIADMLALCFEALLWQPGAYDWAQRIFPAERRAGDYLQDIMPRPGECWRGDVEALIDSVRISAWCEAEVLDREARDRVEV